MRGKKVFFKAIKVSGGMIHFDMSKPEQLKRLSAVMEKAADEIGSKYDSDTQVDPRAFSREIAEEFDKIFGKNATIKTFGTITPIAKQWEEFVDKFSVLINKWTKEV